MNYHKQNPKGFTIIELMIVVGILVFVALAAFGTRYVIKDQTEFQQANQDVIGILQDARNLAVSGESYIDYLDYDRDGSFEDTILPHGYIVNFLQVPGENVKAMIVADLYSSQIGQIDIGEKEDKVIKTIELADSIGLSIAAFRQSGLQNMDIDENNLSVIYATPNAAFSLVDHELNSVQIEIKQFDEDNEVVRNKYAYMHYLYGTPELLDVPYIDAEAGGGEEEPPDGEYENSV